MRVNYSPRPPDPLDTLLGRAVECAEDAAVRNWLLALLEEGERAGGPSPLMVEGGLLSQSVTGKEG
jgi:hypothetical protein